MTYLYEIIDEEGKRHVVQGSNKYGVMHVYRDCHHGKSGIIRSIKPLN